MDFQKEYSSKLVSPEQAVKDVRSGDVIDYGFFNGKPVVLDQALAKRAGELQDVSVYFAVTVPPLPEVVKHPGSFIYIDWQWSKLTRMISQAVGPSYYSPILYHYAPELYESFEGDPGQRSFYYNDPDRRKGVKWFTMIQVAPMDANGYFNLGPQNSETAAKIQCCDRVIVEVNRNMPVCLGGAQESVHISDVDYIVEAPAEQKCYDMPQGAPSEVDRKIAENIMKEIHDGCCIQLGIGGIPNMVGKLIAQSDLKDLGGHTEMVVDAYVDMIESGRVNGRRKEIDRGRVAYTFAIGSQRLYDHLHNNPAYASFPVGYTNDPRTISRISNMVSICNAVQIDLFSQVNAESFKGSQISGNGGMWDFVLGATWSPGGKSFLCMPSTYVEKDGKLRSRIIPALSIGSITTIPRQMVDYIVTEYGAVKLAGNPTWMRAEKIIEIAHPDFRDALIREADNFKIWRRSNKKVNVA